MCVPLGETSPSPLIRISSRLVLSVQRALQADSRNVVPSRVAILKTPLPFSSVGPQFCRRAFKRSAGLQHLPQSSILTFLAWQNILLYYSDLLSLGSHKEIKSQSTYHVLSWSGMYKVDSVILYYTDIKISHDPTHVVVSGMTCSFSF